MVLWMFLSGFVFGSLFVLALQSLGLLYLLSRLRKKTRDRDALTQQSQPRDLDPHQSVHLLASNKQGVVWVLDPNTVPKDQKKKKDLWEVSPVQRRAKIKDRSLVLTEPDGSHTSIQLKSCVVEAVSATTLPSKKWAKKFPIKVESKNSAIYHGSKVFYIYLETSWEKESWCKALRLASCDDKERLDWFSKLNEEFHSYLTSLNTGYPTFMKPSVVVHAEPVDRAARNDGSSSKVRQLWKKLSKKAGKTNAENRAGWISSSGREERKIIEKSRQPQDSGLAFGSVKTALVKALNSSSEDNVFLPSPPAVSRSGSQSHMSVFSDADSDDKFNIDEGTLCWNLLISRLFFDAKSNSETKKVVQARIQRTLSSMRTPSYVGDIICTDIDLGNVPPYVHGMRILPMDMNEVWALEVDFEYSGGVVLSVETRLEARELDIIQKGIGDTNSESGADGDFSSDLLEEIEYYGKQLNLSTEAEGELDQTQKDEGDPKHDTSKGSKSSVSASTSKWKSLLNSIAKQVSQVPISLAIRVASLRGTLRIHIKPPPSDQLWFSFTVMPDIDFNLDSSVGDHKISNGRIALLLISRFKAAIRETLVLPNCESVCVPFMQAEKDDWIPSKAAPYIWLNQEVVSDPTPMREAFNPQPGVVKTKPKTEANGNGNGNSNTVTSSDDHLESKHKKPEKVEEPINRLPGANTLLPSSIKPLVETKSFQELKTPLLGTDNDQETKEEVAESSSSSSSGSLVLAERSLSFNNTIGEDDAKPKRLGRKARMLDIGRKMGEKLEEKRRHIEEKSRTIVEKMRTQ